MSNPFFYSDVVNKKFSQNESHYVTLEERLNENLNAEWEKSMLFNAQKNFERNNPNVKKFEDLDLCESFNIKLSDVMIDTTLQRELTLHWVCVILDTFNSCKVSPISVYRDPNKPDKFICWDGQHTVICLYIIATRILNLDPKKIIIPATINSSKQKAMMRECFISLNGDGKKQLDKIDIIHQQIFGVRTDGSKNPIWLLVNEKYKYLENKKIFLTHEKFNDNTQNGAMTRLKEFLDHTYDPIITKYFADFYFAMCRGNRPVMEHESWSMYEFFKLCLSKDNKITVDEHFIDDIAYSLNKSLNGIYTFSHMYAKAHECYKEWYRENKPNPDGTVLGISYDHRGIMMTYMLAQIRKHYNGKLPNYKNIWPIRKTDLL